MNKRKVTAVASSCPTIIREGTEAERKLVNGAAEKKPGRPRSPAGGEGATEEEGLGEF